MREDVRILAVLWRSDFCFAMQFNQLGQLLVNGEEVLPSIVVENVEAAVFSVNPEEGMIGRYRKLEMGLHAFLIAAHRFAYGERVGGEAWAEKFQGRTVRYGYGEWSSQL